MLALIVEETTWRSSSLQLKPVCTNKSIICLAQEYPIKSLMFGSVLYSCPAVSFLDKELTIIKYIVQELLVTFERIRTFAYYGIEVIKRIF